MTHSPFQLDRLSSEERGAAPVIGVILMVALTVVAAALIGTYVLDLGSDVKDNPQAGVEITEKSGTDDTVVVTVNSIQKAEKITVTGDGTITGDSELTAVGQSTEVSDLDPGDKVVVTATYKGNTIVIKTYTFGS